MRPGISGEAEPTDLARAKQALLQELVRAHLVALSSPSWRVRKKAVRGLGDLGPQSRDIIPALQAALKDQHPKVREAAAAAIRDCG